MDDQTDDRRFKLALAMTPIALKKAVAYLMREVVEVPANVESQQILIEQAIQEGGLKNHNSSDGLEKARVILHCFLLAFPDSTERKEIFRDAIFWKVLFYAMNTQEVLELYFVQLGVLSGNSVNQIIPDLLKDLNGPEGAPFVLVSEQQIRTAINTVLTA